jgi:regulator of sirC expression with transglutaminase-like and TPR domain
MSLSVIVIQHQEDGNMIATGEIQALITLLGDDDTHVRDIARERLLQIGEPATEFLREAGSADVDGKIRIEARHVLAQIRQDDLSASFYLLSVLDEEQVDLEHAVFLLARFGYPDLDLAPYRRELDALANEAARRIRGLHPLRDNRRIVRLINQFLFNDEGFSGNIEDYYDPDNSYVNCVLERRTGIPITLSVIYILLARRLRLPIHGINLPVHFVCQYYSPPDSFYFDPFHNGKTLSRADCVMLLHRVGVPFHDNCLAPARTRDIIARMARNLIVIYHHRDDPAKVEALDRVLKMLESQ